MSRKIEIRTHPRHPKTHSMVVVTVNGRVWAIAWAGTPTPQEAEDAWIADRRAFESYDETTGIFLSRG